MPTPPPNIPIPQDDVHYTVMPNPAQKFAPLPQPTKPPISQTPIPPPGAALPQVHRAPVKKWVMVGGGIILVILLGILSYFMFFGREDSKPAIQTKLPKIWLNQHFGSETCADVARCGDEADPDNDGLSNYNEFKEGTNPNKPDSDDDGLADGDEVNIYKTDPGLKYTDRRDIAVLKDFNDARDVADGFDPLTPGIRMTETRLRQIDDDTKTYGLHEPTVSTLQRLRGNLQRSPESYSVFIETDRFVPTNLTIVANDTVIWLNKDANKHKLVSDTQSFESPDLLANQTYSFKFAQPGMFGYSDAFNPSLKGTVTVK